MLFSDEFCWIFIILVLLFFLNSSCRKPIPDEELDASSFDARWVHYIMNNFAGLQVMLKAKPERRMLSDMLLHMSTEDNRLIKMILHNMTKFVKVTECALVTMMIDIILATHSSGNIMDTW